jgi:hypothetical protein
MVSLGVNLSEQSGRELASADATTGAADATVQISEQAQEFPSTHSFIYGHFHPRRHQLVAHTHRTIRSEVFEIWRQETCAQRAA